MDQALDVHQHVQHREHDERQERRHQHGLLSGEVLGVENTRTCHGFPSGCRLLQEACQASLSPCLTHPVAESDDNEGDAGHDDHQQQREQQRPMLAGEAVLLVQGIVVRALLALIEEVAPLGRHALPLAHLPGKPTQESPGPGGHLCADTLPAGLGLWPLQAWQGAVGRGPLGPQVHGHRGACRLHPRPRSLRFWHLPWHPGQADQTHGSSALQTHKATRT